MSGTATAQRVLPATSTFSLRMVWGVVLINLFVFGMAASVLYQSHEEYEEHLDVVAQNQSRMLALDMNREFDKINLTLLAAQDEIQGQLGRGIDATRLNAVLRRLRDHVPEIISLRMTDANGIVRYGVGVDPKVRIDNSDREYFVRQRADPQAGLVVASPVMARIDKRWVVVVSRALRREDGSFAGVVYANVSIDHLEQLLASVEVGPRDSSSLRDIGLRIYARYPVPLQVDKVYGKRLDVPELQALIDAGRDAGTYVSSHTVDGVERRFAVRQVDKLPLYVVVGRASVEYMQPWRKQAEKTLAVSLLFFLTSLAASWLIYRSWHSQVSATAELAREEEKFHTMADYTYDWEYWQGSQHEMLYTSPSCERITGYTPAEFQADSNLLYRIIHPDDLHLMEAHVHDSAYEDEASVDFRIVRRNGDVRWIAHACRAVYGRDGRFMGRRASNRDITERKTAEEKVQRLNAELELRVAQRTALLESANKEIEDVSYSVSHDMLIPLRAINGFSQILLEEQSSRLDDEGKRMLTVVHDNARRMGGQINGILSFLQMGRRVLVFTNVDIAMLAQEVFAELRAASPGRSMRFELGYLPPARGDREMLREVLKNLLSNAIKFSPAKSETVIELSGTAAEAENIYQVKDYGIGFDMQYVDKLFKVFERVHPTGQYEGSGIGLAIVKRIVTRHGGRVWAEGKVNEGATIYFALPNKGESHE